MKTASKNENNQKNEDDLKKIIPPIRGIGHARTNRKDDIFMQRRLVQNFTKRTRHWTYSALRHFYPPSNYPDPPGNSPDNPSVHPNYPDDYLDQNEDYLSHGLNHLCDYPNYLGGFPDLPYN